MPLDRCIFAVRLGSGSEEHLIEERIDRGAAALGNRGVTRHAARFDLDPEAAFRAGDEAAAGRLAADQISGEMRAPVGRESAVGTALFPDELEDSELGPIPND